MKGTLLFFVLVALLIGYGCKKTKFYYADAGTVAFVNAAPGMGDSITAPGFFVATDSVIRTNNNVPYMGNTSYLQVTPGPHDIFLVSSLDTSTIFFQDDSVNFETNKGYTYFIYDTISATNPTLKAVKLTDDLVIPPDEFVDFRFLHASANTGPLDISFVRLAPANDSLTVTNKTYIGTTPDPAALSAFSSRLPAGDYIIKLKTAGTQNVLAMSDTVNYSTSIHTFFATGAAAGQPLGIGGFKHYP